MVPVAAALPHQHRLVLREKLGDRQPERLAAEPRIEPDVATRDEVGDARRDRAARGTWTMRSWLENRAVLSSITQRSGRAASAASIASGTKGTFN